MIDFKTDKQERKQITVLDEIDETKDFSDLKRLKTLRWHRARHAYILRMARKEAMKESLTPYEHYTLINWQGDYLRLPTNNFQEDDWNSQY